LLLFIIEGHFQHQILFAVDLVMKYKKAQIICEWYHGREGFYLLGIEMR